MQHSGMYVKMFMYMYDVGAIALSGLTVFGGDSRQLTLFHNVECNGTEESIFDCRRREGAGGCQQRQDASVVCQGGCNDVQMLP